jgi:hypothetical protein
LLHGGSGDFIVINYQTVHGVKINNPLKRLVFFLLQNCKSLNVVMNRVGWMYRFYFAIPGRVAFPDYWVTGVFFYWCTLPACNLFLLQLLKYSSSRRMKYLFNNPDMRLAMIKKKGTKTVLVRANLGNNRVSYSVPAGGANSTCRHVLNGETAALTTQVSLHPDCYFVLRL